MPTTTPATNPKLRMPRPKLRKVLLDEYGVHYSETQQWRDQTSGKLDFSMLRGKDRGMCSSVEDYFQMVERETQAERKRRGIEKPSKAKDPEAAEREYADRAKAFQSALCGNRG